MGHQPSNRKPSKGVAFPFEAMTYRVSMLQPIQDKVTARILALITDGASRDRCGDGRVVEER